MGRGWAGEEGSGGGSGTVTSVNGALPDGAGAVTLTVDDLGDPNVSALSGLALAADKGVYATGAGALATYDLTSFGRTFAGQASYAAMLSLIGGVDSAGAATVADTEIAAALTAHTVGPDPIVTSWVTVYDGTFATGTTQPASLTDASMTGLSAGGNEAGSLGVIAASFASAANEQNTGSGQGGLGSTAATNQPYNTTDFPSARVPVAIYKPNGEPPILSDVAPAVAAANPESASQPVYAYLSDRSDLGANAKKRLWWYFRSAATSLETPFTPTVSIASCSVLVPIAKYQSTQSQAERRNRPQFTGQAAEVAAATTSAAGIVQLAAQGETSSSKAPAANDVRFADTVSTAETDGATVTLDLADATKGRRRKLTLTGDAHTITATLTSFPTGALVYLEIVQDGTGGWDCVFDTAVFSGFIRGPNLAASTTTEYIFRYDGSKLQQINQHGYRKKTVAGTTYTVLAQDHRTRLVFTSASSIAVTMIAAATAGDGFEFGWFVSGAGLPTFTRASTDVFYWDPAQASGTTTFAAQNQFDDFIFVADTGPSPDAWLVVSK